MSLLLGCIVQNGINNNSDQCVTVLPEYYPNNLVIFAINDVSD